MPVWLTDHCAKLTRLEKFDAEGCEMVIGQIEAWRECCLGEHGTRFVQLADEFYLQAGLPLPQSEAYEEFFPLDNGSHAGLRPDARCPWECSQAGRVSYCLARNWPRSALDCPA